MRYALMMLAVFLAGCQTVPVDTPCGVIRDDLRGVTATARDGNKRLAIHYERGRAAGCWGR